ncbi:TPA: 50S ribosomal protein L19 [Candidatus Uhrbacteria bacterium]|nr:50S ribosomal protein L19 [Candidatus Uhrbacteria bacterium]HCB56003.1 50S ribosomal protein L19 [Candidatus Uhrbacteria bacterium]
MEEPAEEEAPEAAYQAKLIDFKQLKPGMTVRVHERIKDISPKGEERERIQIFEGIILWLKGSGISRTMTVRKMSKGFGVEKIYPINSPVIAKIELVKKARVCRAKLGYLKDLKHRFKRKLKETRPA